MTEMQRILTYAQMEAINDLDRGRTDGGVGCIYDGTHYLCRDVTGVEGYEEYQTIMAASQPYIPPMTVLDFMRRFTAQERIAIRASADPVLVDFLWLLDHAPNVVVTDPDTVAGINYVESLGLIAAGRGAEVLAA